MDIWTVTALSRAVLTRNKPACLTLSLKCTVLRYLLVTITLKPELRLVSIISHVTSARSVKTSIATGTDTTYGTGHTNSADGMVGRAVTHNRTMETVFRCRCTIFYCKHFAVGHERLLGIHSMAGASSPQFACYKVLCSYSYL